MSVTDEIKDRIDIVDVVSESVELRRAGKNYTGFCPFHHNVNTPSFVVFPDTQTWKCFGECDDGGDVFSFVMKREGWDFSEALRNLAERAGVVLKPLTPEMQEVQEESERLRQLLEDAVAFYQRNLLETQGGKKALDYLGSRGLDADTIGAFKLGYAPNSWDASLNHFRKNGFTIKEIQDAGLVSEKEEGRIYDRFRHRLMIPIRDRRGGMVGFGARVLDPEDMPKYLNSPQTQIFDKSRLLFGLDMARKHIREMDQVVIVEGYMGVIGPHQHGFKNIVAQMGTALNEYQLRVLKKYTDKFIIAMDSDAAGQKATLRGLQIAREALDRSPEVVFDARGLLHQEGRLKADIRVLTLPQGMDPDDVTRQDPEIWRSLIDDARPVVVHVMDTLAQNQDLDNPKVKSAIASQVLPLIDDLPDPIERDVYTQRLSRLLEINEKALLQFRPARKRKRQTVLPTISPRKAEPPTREIPRREGEIYEKHCVGILLREPELIYKVDRELNRVGLDQFDYKDFQTADFQVLVRLIKESLNQQDEEPCDFIINNIPNDFIDIVDELFIMTQNINARSDKVRDDLLRAFYSLRKHQIEKQNDHYRFLQEIDHQNGDYKTVDYQKIILQNIQKEHKIDIELNRLTSRMSALDS